MSEKNKSTNIYDDGNIPNVDLPSSDDCNATNTPKIVEPLPESTRPRQDGPGGNQSIGSSNSIHHKKELPSN